MSQPTPPTTAYVTPAKKPRKPYTWSAKTIAKRKAETTKAVKEALDNNEVYRKGEAYDGVKAALDDWKEMYDEMKVKYTKKCNSVDTLYDRVDKAEEENEELKRALMEMTAAYLKAKKN